MSATGKQPMQQPPRSKATKKHVILFLAANPHDAGRLALDCEARSIHLELKGSGYRERFEFVSRWAAEPLDLLRELRTLKPTVVHFSGHGGLEGLSFRGADSSAREVSAEAGAETVGAAGGAGEAGGPHAL